MGVRKKPGTRKDQRTRDGGPASGSVPVTAAGSGPGADGFSGGPEGTRPGGHPAAIGRKLKRHPASGNPAGRREAQRAFLSQQTHQIRAQLHAVMGYAELVLEKPKASCPFLRWKI